MYEFKYSSVLINEEIDSLDNFIKKHLDEKTVFVLDSNICIYLKKFYNFPLKFKNVNEESGLSTLFCTTFIRSYLQDDILPESCIPKYCEYVYNCTIKHNFSTLYSTLLSF